MIDTDVLSVNINTFAFIHKITPKEFVERGASAELTQLGRDWIDLCNILSKQYKVSPRDIADAAWGLVSDFKKYVCADCGHEQNEMNICRNIKCLGQRVILIEMAEKLFGVNWRKCFTDEPFTQDELPPDMKMNSDGSFSKE